MRWADSDARGNQVSDAMVPKPDVLLYHYDPMYKATRKHLAQLVARYGTPLLMLDLLKLHEKKQRETKLGTELAAALACLGVERVSMGPATLGTPRASPQPRTLERHKDAPRSPQHPPQRVPLLPASASTTPPLAPTSCRHVYMHACIHTYTHACMHACMHTHTHTHTHIHIYAHTHTHTHTHTHSLTHTHTLTHSLTRSLTH